MFLSFWAPILLLTAASALPLGQVPFLTLAYVCKLIRPFTSLWRHFKMTLRKEINLRWKNANACKVSLMENACLRLGKQKTHANHGPVSTCQPQEQQHPCPLLHFIKEQRRSTTSSTPQGHISLGFSHLHLLFPIKWYV